MSSQKTGCVYFLMSSILTFSFSFSFIIIIFFCLVADFITKWIIVAIDLLVRFYTRNLLLFSLRMLLLRLLLLSQILYPLTRLLYFIVASYVSIGYHYVNVFAIVFIPTTVIPVVIDIIFVHLSIGFFFLCVLVAAFISVDTHATIIINYILMQWFALYIFLFLFAGNKYSRVCNFVCSPCNCFVISLLSLFSDIYYLFFSLIFYVYFFPVLSLWSNLFCTIPSYLLKVSCVNFDKIV